MKPYDVRIRRVVTAGLLLAITLLLVFTNVGMIPVPTPAGHATISHIPAIIAGILEGPLVGMIVGMGFGFASFSVATVPMFKDPMVAIVPRLFIGVVAAFVYAALRRADRRIIQGLVVVLLLALLAFSWQIYGTRAWLGIVVGVASLVGAGLLFRWIGRQDVQSVSVAIAAAAGSLTNTVLVLGVATLRHYIPAEAAWGIGLLHGIPELIVSAVVTVAVAAALGRVGGRRSAVSRQMASGAGPGGH